MFGQQLGRNQNAYQQALQANQQNFGQSMAGSQYANQIRQQQISEAMQKRGFNLNEINALLSGQQVGMPQMPNFSAAQQAAVPNYGQYATAQASADNASNPWGQILGAGTTLGAAALMSDRRLKTNIKPIGTLKGYPAYSYDYIWGQRGVGVMADEIPEKYTFDVGGFKAVDYGALLGE